MAAGAVPFTITITALLGVDARRATRLQAASAMVLADRWEAAGCRDVCVTDQDGIGHNRASFRVALRQYQSRKGRLP